MLVTDDPGMRSETWTVVYDEEFAKMPLYRKFYWVRYHPFRYVSSDVCVRIDGSIQLKGSLDRLVGDFLASGKDIGLLAHPCISTFPTELRVWQLRRGYPAEAVNRFLRFLVKTRYDMAYRGYFQLTASVKKRTKFTDDVCNLTYDLMMANSDDRLPERLDQTWFAYVMNTFFSDSKVFLIHPQATESYAMQRYEHRTTVPASIAGRYDVNIPYKAWCFNRLQECYFLKE